MKRVLAVVAAGAVLAGGATYTVAELGGDDGRQVAPGESWQTAYVAASCGDVITVKSGSHPAQVLKRDPAKDSCTTRVVFRGESGAKLAGFTTGASGGSGNTRGADHFELDSIDYSGQLKLILADDVVLRNLGDGNVTPSSGRNSFVIASSTNVQILGGEFGPWVDGVNHVSRCGSNPVCPPARNVLIEGATLHDFLISDPAPHSECIMVWGTESQAVTFRNVVMRNCTDFNILVKAPGASQVVIEDSWFDVPMPGAVATTGCNPNCPRSGSSIRFSGATNTYPGSAVRNNVVNGAITVDCGCVAVSGNTKGPVPDRPTGQTPPPTTTTEPPPATTEPPTTTVPEGFKLTEAASTATTVTYTWVPPEGADGYRFWRDGKIVSHTWDGGRSSVRFGAPGSYRVDVLGVTESATAGK